MTPINILFTAAGRRVSLLRSFSEAMLELGIEGSVLSGDATRSAAAGFVADERLMLPRVDAQDYIESLLKICVDKKVNVLVSLIDTDLELLTKNESLFASNGIKLLLSGEETMHLSCDKVRSYEFFIENNINTPKVYMQEEFNSLGVEDLPLIVKPWDGSSSVGVNIVETVDDLHFQLKNTRNPMAQQLLRGDEYTCDAYVDLSGAVRCVVPRKRLETRAGEVSKGLTVKDQVIIDAVVDCVSKLPKALGCITVQCFKEPDGTVSFIEINPRFGGGHPLTIASGANFPKWILQELTTGQCDASFDCWQDDLAMLRFDDAVFVDGNSIR